MSKISVIVPSRLQANPASGRGSLYLDRALMSARRQRGGFDLELVVGLDAGAPPLPERFSDVVVAHAVGAGQAAAVNAAVRASSGDVLAFLEDDDMWEPWKLETQLPYLGPTFDMVTCTQRLIDAEGNHVTPIDRFTGKPMKFNDFATPSGWVMHRDTWERVGGMNESFRFHVDNDWLGRASEAGVKRVHLIESEARWRARLGIIARYSVVVETEHAMPIVVRTVNPEGGMQRIARAAALPPRDPGRLDADQSEAEHVEMMRRFGGVIPW